MISQEFLLETDPNTDLLDKIAGLTQFEKDELNTKQVYSDHNLLLTEYAKMLELAGTEFNHYNYRNSLREFKKYATTHKRLKFINNLLDKSEEIQYTRRS